MSLAGVLDCVEFLFASALAKTLCLDFLAVELDPGLSGVFGFVALGGYDSLLGELALFEERFYSISRSSLALSETDFLLFLTGIGMNELIIGFLGGGSSSTKGGVSGLSFTYSGYGFELNWNLGMSLDKS